MKILGYVPMYIEVLIENAENGRSIWVPLPATKNQFEKALKKIDCDYSALVISDYSAKMPGVSIAAFMGTPLAAVNHPSNVKFSRAGIGKAIPCPPGTCIDVCMTVPPFALNVTLYIS